MYALVENNIVKNVGKLPANWKNISGLYLADDATLLALGWYPVIETKVTVGPTEVQIKDLIAVVGNTVTKVEQVRAMTTSEKAERMADQWQDIRSKRNTLISATDWRFRSDQTPSQAWIDYCQALRDITSQADPFNIVWPTEPG